MRLTGPFTAVVRWETSEACNSIVEFGTDDALGSVIQDSDVVTEHAVRLTDLQYRTKYYYRVGHGGRAGMSFTDLCTFNGGINYSRIDCSAAVSPYPSDSMTPLYEAAAESIVSRTGITKGYCLVYGCGDGRLAFELARRTDLMIIGVETDATLVDAAIHKLMQAGVYGARIKIRRVDSLASLPFTRNFFNLVVSQDAISGGQCVGLAAEVFRVLRPSGGVACFGQPSDCPEKLDEAVLTDWLNAASLTYSVSNDISGLWCTIVRGPLPGAGQWPHQYGRADNAANDGDTLEGAVGTDELMVQWLGYPGADFGADRNPRMPTPVMANGRMYYQGLDRILAMDSYNGAIYWSLEIPGLLRVNTPRDCGYMYADENGLYLAVDDDCWYLDGDTGVRTKTYKLDDDGKEWGYVAREGDLLYGSAQLDGAHYTNIWGGPGWYDHRSDPSATAKVCSKYLFADDVNTGDRVWTYDSTDFDKGIIINSTITIGGGRMYFVECRNSTVESYQSGRIGIADLWSQQYLVALDLLDGSVLWQKPINLVEGVPVFFLLYTNETLILTSSSSTHSRYYLYAYEANDGANKAGWPSNPVSHAWTADNHGGHMQHPTVVGNNIYLEPKGYNLSTGADLGITMGPREGCSTRAGTADSLLYRGSGRQIAIWDVNTGAVSTWNKLRPSCWLSTIPAGAMVLSPEGGGGCSCNEWFQTSVGFICVTPGSGGTGR